MPWRQPVQFVAAGLLLTVALLGRTAPSVGAGHPLLAEDPANEHWHFNEPANEMVYLGTSGGAEPRLVLNRQPMTEAPVTLTIQTDSRDCVVWSGQWSFPVRMRRSRDNPLTFDGHPEHPNIQFEGKDLASAKGAWTAICLAEQETLTLTFPNAGYANVKLGSAETGKAAAGSTPITTLPDTTTRLPTPTPTPREATPEVPGAAVEQMLGRARQAVFQIRAVARQNPQVTLLATGFLIDPEGYAITTASWLNAAASVLAVFPSNDRQVAVQVFAVRPELDLALIRVRDPDADSGAMIQPLALAPQIPAEKAAVWALGIDRHGSYTMGRGQIEPLPRAGRSRSSAEARDSAAWLAASCPVHAHNAGGPLVDETGRVVGMCAWTWNEKGQAFSALEVTSVRALLAGKPAQPLTLEQVGQMYASTGGPSRTFPRLLINSAGTTDALVAAARRFTLASQCPACRGTGQVTRTVSLSPESRGGTFVRSQSTGVETACASCAGSGVHNREKLADFAADLAAHFAAANRVHPQYPDALNFLRKTLRDAVDRPSRGLAMTLNDGALLRISRGRPSVGSAVTFIGQVVRQVRLLGDEQQLTLVKIGESEKLAVISEPSLVEVGQSSTVIVGGLLGGFVDNPEVQGLPVLQQGFILGQSPEAAATPSR